MLCHILRHKIDKLLVANLPILILVGLTDYHVIVAVVEHVKEVAKGFKDRPKLLLRDVARVVAIKETKCLVQVVIMYMEGRTDHSSLEFAKFNLIVVIRVQHFENYPGAVYWHRIVPIYCVLDYYCKLIIAYHAIFIFIRFIEFVLYILA